MRHARAILALISASLVAGLAGGLAACSKGEDGAAAARKEAEAEAAKSAATSSKAVRIHPPVPAGTTIPCDELINLAGFQSALQEQDPLTFKDLTASNKDSTASCSLVRGGKRLTAAEQEALLKKQRRLGVMGGDEICNVTAFCSTVEDDAHFKQRCKEMGFQDDESLGSYACLQVVAQGADDVYSFRILDEDTKCILQVRGGPSMVDNAVIMACAKAARDLIGPDNIKVGGKSANPPPPDDSGSGSGSDTGSGG